MDDPKEFGATFKKFMDQMAVSAPREESWARTRLSEHFEADPDTLPILDEDFGAYDHPNVQQALEACLAEAGCTHELVGVRSPHFAYKGLALADLLEDGPRAMGGVERGPVEYTNVRLANGSVLPCLQRGVVFAKRTSGPVACAVQGPNARGHDHSIHVQVMARDRATAGAFLADLHRAMHARNVFRGHVLSLGGDQRSGMKVYFHTLPTTRREDIVLPEEVLDRIEDQTLGFARHSARLAASGRHLKRGVLLYGPPGTGKTLTAMYLAREMEGRTVLLMTGRGQGMIEHVCSMARMLAPSTVILEDVDLIAEDRRRDPSACMSPLLFELLNQMDGLAADTDVLFLLTTNRPDVLEPALASRPGRVDLAIEIPLPDERCRDRLLELYGRGLEVRLADRGSLLRRTAGASASFLRELVRKAALRACDRPGELVVTDEHFDRALHELVVTGGLTRTLLGFERPADEAEGAAR